jgi:hypothetical protein
MPVSRLLALCGMAVAASAAPALNEAELQDLLAILRILDDAE